MLVCAAVPGESYGYLFVMQEEPTDQVAFSQAMTIRPDRCIGKGSISVRLSRFNGRRIYCTSCKDCINGWIQHTGNHIDKDASAVVELVHGGLGRRARIRGCKTTDSLAKALMWLDDKFHARRTVTDNGEGMSLKKLEPWHPQETVRSLQSDDSSYWLLETYSVPPSGSGYNVAWLLTRLQDIF